MIDEHAIEEVMIRIKAEWSCSEQKLPMCQRKRIYIRPMCNTNSDLWVETWTTTSLMETHDCSKSYGKENAKHNNKVQNQNL